MACCSRLATAIRRLALLLAWLAPVPALAAGCAPAVAERTPQLLPAAWTLAAAAPGTVDVTFIGHASFLIESPAGVTVVTDYNDYFRAPIVPEIATMNHAHDTHYSDHPDPGIKYVLRGWDPEGGEVHYDMTVGDVHIRNVQTNIRNYASGGTEFGGNSIFVFDIADLCIAHLGHLQHLLTADHLAALGQIDVLMAPIDGAYTMSQEDMIQVIEQIHPELVIVMHYWGPNVLQRFFDRLGGRYPVRRSDTPQVTLSRASLPASMEFLVLPGY